MKNTVSEMRETYESYKSSLKSDNGNWQSHPVMEWYGRKYVVTGNIKLTTDLQRLEVIDITNDNKIALFSKTWPEFSPSNRHYALVHHSDEGHDLILQESGYESWVNYAELPIRVCPGTKQDATNVRMAQMDELEQSVDNGGRIF